MRPFLFQPVGGRNIVQLTYGDFEVFEDAVFYAVDPSVNGQVLSVVPGVLNDGRVADIGDLLDYVQFAEQVLPRCFIRQRIDFVLMIAINIFDVAQPVVNQSVTAVLKRRTDPATSVVTTDDDVFYLKKFDSILNDRKTIEIRVHDHIGDVAMDEYFPGRKIDNLRGGDAAVRAADPQIFRVLLSG